MQSKMTQFARERFSFFDRKTTYTNIAVANDSMRHSSNKNPVERKLMAQNVDPKINKPTVQAQLNGLEGIDLNSDQQQRKDYVASELNKAWTNGQKLQELSNILAEIKESLKNSLQQNAENSETIGGGPSRGSTRVR